MTDSPKVAEIMMRSGLERTYNIKIDKPLTAEMEEAMRHGLILDDARAGGHEKSKIYAMEFAPFIHYELRGVSNHFTKLRVTIAEGKNRELRRFFAHFDATILDLKRVAFGKIELNNLPTNKTRFFSRREYDDLHKYLKPIQRMEAQQQKEEQDRINAQRLKEKKRQKEQAQKERKEIKKRGSKR
jgi:23S rRNA pseudouridine2605 synthase